MHRECYGNSENWQKNLTYCNSPKFFCCTVFCIVNGCLTLLGTLPAEADYLLAYATIPGYVSWRNNENGSWFVSALVNVFIEMGDKEHLMDMLTEVNRRVAEEFESRSGKNKQVPEPVSRLRKKLYFRPGKYS